MGWGGRELRFEDSFVVLTFWGVGGYRSRKVGCRCMRLMILRRWRGR